ncbi:MAG: hypothetical protein M3Z36_13675, partial [Acidobacteriota bacterium]|nr:hypothetical protein [Acidobacteriota bacterium]
MRFNWLFAATILFACTISNGAAQTAPADYSFDNAQHFLKTYCASCHQGKSPAGGLNVTQLGETSSLRDLPRKWTRIA